MKPHGSAARNAGGSVDNESNASRFWRADGRMDGGRGVGERLGGGGVPTVTQIHFKRLALRGQMPAMEKVRAIMSLRRQKEEEEEDHGAGRRGSALLGV